MIRLTAALLAAATFLLPASRGRAFAGAPDEAAVQLAKKLTEKGAATFDTKNAQAMSNSYIEDAEVSLVSKSDEGYSTKVYKGRIEIESLYRDFFKDPEGIKSKNEVDVARLIQPDILTIDGTFEIQRGSQTFRLPFFQERIKQGDDWLISSLRLYVTRP